MKIKHKLLSIILSIILPVSVLQVTASAYSGACGDNAIWTYDDKTCTLTISGSGEMYDYKSKNRPWEGYEDEIKCVVIEDGITSIGAYAFYDFDNLLEVKIPDSVTTIAANGFRFCYSLKSIKIPDTVTMFDKYAFASCISLKELTIPGSISTMGNGVFSGCTELTTVRIEDGVKIIGDRAFEECGKLTSIIIPDSVTSIGVNAFNRCESLEKVIIGDGVITIGSGAFSDSIWDFYPPITELKIGNSVKTIGKYAFLGCNKLEKIIIPDSVETIEEIAFRECTGLTNVVIGKGVKTIGERVFERCQKLTTVAIHDNIEAIEHAAFSKCQNLKDVYYEGSEEEWQSIAIDITDSLHGNNDYLLNATIHYNHKHSYTNPVITPATCTEQGYTTSTCVCGAVSVGDYVEAGHSPEEAIEENVVLPTCTEPGTKDVVVYCSVCKEEVSRETVTIEATGHDYSTSTYVAPPCTEKGYTIYKCHCGASALRDFVDITGHIDSDSDGICDQCNKSLNSSTTGSPEADVSGIFSIFNILLELFEKLLNSFGFLKV